MSSAPPVHSICSPESALRARPVAVSPIGQPDFFGYAADFADQLPQIVAARSKARHCIQQKFQVDVDRKPGIAQSGRAAKRCLAFAADPDRWVGLLGRLGPEGDAGEVDELAGIAWPVLGL